MSSEFHAVSIPTQPLEKQILNITPHPRLHFETHIVEHCNLNCQMCTHFSPLASPEFAKIEAFSNDMRRLHELFSDSVSYILLLGGEPTLHPQLHEFLKTARDSFPHTEIILYTNGLMLPRMQNRFWESCRENCISITLTRYPVKMDYERVDQLLEAHGIAYKYCNTPGRSKSSSYFPFDLQGTQDPRHSFLNCDMANRCIFLRAGRLYTCPLIGNIRHFNSYFQENLNVSPMDSIDIYQASTGSEIMRFLASPPSFCRYCDVSRRTILNQWKQSGKSIAEWT